jgi:hypothetical protein
MSNELTPSLSGLIAAFAWDIAELMLALCAACGIGAVIAWWLL